jgi:outer membrane protein TolC
MQPVSRGFCSSLLIGILLAPFSAFAAAEQVPLKRVVELALSHGTALSAADAAAQRAYAAYRESRNQYLPTLVVGSGLGKTWGFPLSLEGSAPAIVNTTAQSALINPALREFVRQARTEWEASQVASKDQREQVIEDAVLSYTELNKWESLLAHLTEEYSAALKMEQLVNERIQAGVDNPQARNQARLNAARVYLHITQAQGSIDVLRSQLSHWTGLPAASIETDPESIPSLLPVKPEVDFLAKATAASPAIQIANLHATALQFYARGEHRSMWPTVDFASQYALLAKFNNYQDYFKTFEYNNASIGAVIRFPFFSPSLRARAQAADAEALEARKDLETTKNNVSEQTLKLERSVEQLAAARDVADLEYQVAKSNLEAVEIKVDSGTASLHDEDDARNQANERYNTLEDAAFELERAQITLLHATGELSSWVGVTK